MSKTLLNTILLLTIFVSPSLVEAKLSDDQLDQVMQKISEVCSDFENEENRQEINTLFNNNSIESGAFLPPQDYSVKDCDEHKLRFFSERIFLNGVDISTVSQNIELNQNVEDSVIDGSVNQILNTGDNSPIKQNNIWVELFLSKGTITGAIIGGLVTFFLSKIFSYFSRRWKKRKNKSKTDNSTSDPTVSN